MIEIICNILLDAFLFEVVVLLGLLARLFYLDLKKAERDEDRSRNDKSRSI